MITGSDAQASGEVVDDGEDGGLEVQWGPKGSDTAEEWNADNEEGIEPVDVPIEELVS